MAKRKTPEGAVLRAVLDYLAVTKVFHLRINTGAVVSSYNGRTRMIRYGTPGCADILACPAGRPNLWLEIKSETGKSSELQDEFRDRVLAEGMEYVICRSVEDVIEALAGEAE